MSEGWFLIAEFARRCRLPVSTLRYYDRVGLLRPAHVDPVTGYRRYRADQLADAATIARLRTAGCSPAVIAAVLLGGDVRERALAAERRRLAGEIDRLTDALSLLDAVDAVDVGCPAPVRLPPEDVVALEFTAPADRLPAALRRGVATLRARLPGRDRAVDRWGAVLPLDLDDTVVGHVIARLGGALPAGVATLRLPAGDAVVVEHRGARHSLAAAYPVLLDGVARTGAHAVGPVVEWYPATAGTVTTVISVTTSGPVR